jgi:hypothetical protein
VLDQQTRATDLSLSTTKKSNIQPLLSYGQAIETLKIFCKCMPRLLGPASPSFQIKQLGGRFPLRSSEITHRAESAHNEALSRRILRNKRVGS